MHTIENEFISVKVKTLGAELGSIRHKKNGVEYLWDGDAAYWGKQSPVLFPIVGTLKNNQYQYQGTSYNLSRHGFAREMEFTLEEITEDMIYLVLKSNERTLKTFPFYFNFSIRYALQGATLSVTYEVLNKGAGNMYFSVGGHPAFKLPFSDDLAFEDYYLRFDPPLQQGRFPISAEGLLELDTLPVDLRGDRLPLTHELFYKDALVFKNTGVEKITLAAGADNVALEFHLAGFPYLGIWSARDAGFVCIEPWCGIADSVNASGILEEKEGIIKLAQGATFSRTWSVTLY